MLICEHSASPHGGSKSRNILEGEHNTEYITKQAYIPDSEGDVCRVWESGFVIGAC